MLLILLSFSMKDLVNLKVKSLTEKGKLLIVLLDNVNNQDHSVIPVLGIHKLETLFSLLEVVDNDSIEKACLQMLSCYPLASVTMPKSVFIKCLTSKSQIRMEISCIVICQNVEAREWFESWIMERKLVGDHSIVLQVVLHYINGCPERLSESKCSFLLLFISSFTYLIIKNMYYLHYILHVFCWIMKVNVHKALWYCHKFSNLQILADNTEDLKVSMSVVDCTLYLFCIHF